MKKKDNKGSGVKGFFKNPFKKKNPTTIIIENQDYHEDDENQDDENQNNENQDDENQDDDAISELPELTDDITLSDIPANIPLGDDANEQTGEYTEENTGEHTDEHTDSFYEQTGSGVYQEIKAPKEKNPIQNILQSGRNSFKNILSKKKIESQAQKRKKMGKENRFATIGSNFSFSHIMESFLSVEKRPACHRLFILILLATSCYQIAKHLSFIVSDKAQNMAIGGLKTDKRENIANFAAPPLSNSNIIKIAEANLFNVKQSDSTVPTPTKSGPIIANIKCFEASITSGLPITLLNTIVLQDSVKSTASVQVRGNTDTLSLREGEKINNLAEIGKINRLSIVLKNLQSGQCELVKNNEDAPPKTSKPLRVLTPDAGKKVIAASKNDGIQNEGNNFKIKKNVREQMLGNISEVLTQARAVQIKNPDGSFSFKMTEIIPGSIYAQLGIQNDDIITAIDGKKISNLNEIMAMFGRIKDIDNLSISVNRNGVETNMDYNFED